MLILPAMGGRGGPIAKEIIFFDNGIAGVSFEKLAFNAFSRKEQT